MKQTQLRSPGRVAATTVALLSFAALACGTTRASGMAAPVTAAPVVSSEASPPAAPEASSASLPAPPPVEMHPVVLVVPSGDAYLVLGAGIEQGRGGRAWSVMYVAGDDPAALGRPETGARLASIASDFVAAFHPLAELAKLERLSVSALMGRPGATGAIEQRWYVRDGRGWRADGTPQQYAVEQLPAIDGKVVRDREEEAAARAAAAEFASDAGRADYDAAWARTSAYVKATMSRAEFDRHLAALRPVDAKGEARLYLAFAASERFLPGSLMEAWIARDAADGAGVQAVTLRLDDDMQWRVAGLVDMSAAAPQPVFATPGNDSSRTELERIFTP